MIVLALALLSAGAIGSPALPPGWQAWRAVAPVKIGASTAGLVRFAVAPWVYTHASPDLGDLRVIDDRGDEVPFAIDQEQASTTVDWSAAPLSEQGFVRGSYTQAVADTGTPPALHNELTIDTPADEFSTWVDVAASDDERTWRIVRDKAPIFKFSSERLQGDQTVTFDPTRDRWLRVRVLRGAAEFPITGIEIADDQRVVPPLDVISTGLRAAGGAPAGETRLAADLGGPNIRVSAVRFATATREFYRTIEVAASEDGASWTHAGEGEIYRDPRAGSSLDVRFPEIGARYFRVTIFNRSDRPLTGVSASLLATPHEVSFRAYRGRTYRLIYDNPQAHEAQYDFATLTTVDERLRARVAYLGAPEIAPAPPPVVPWTESHAYVLWLALLLAVGVLAWLAVGAMRDKNATPG